MNRINFCAPITPNTGYGITSISILKEMIKEREVDVFPIGNAQAESENDKALFQHLLKQTQKNWDHKSPCLKIWHPNALADRIGSGKYGALTFFEIDRIKLMEQKMINSTDCIFVASQWAKNILLDNNITTKIVVSPLAVNRTIFNINDDIPNKEFLDKQKTYRFINIGKWEIRKGHDILVEAFNKAFDKEDNVELIMMNHNAFLSEEENKTWESLYKTSKLGDKIKILPRLQTQKDVAKIIMQCDCGIFPARAEGWNNEILEVMACNKPVIATDYSAHTEYCNKDNCYLVDIQELCNAKDDKFFDGYGKWANLGKSQIDQMVEHMRYVYKNDIRTNDKGLGTAKEYTWEKTSNTILQELEQ